MWPCSGTDLALRRRVGPPSSAGEPVAAGQLRRHVIGAPGQPAVANRRERAGGGARVEVALAEPDTAATPREIRDPMTGGQTAGTVPPQAPAVDFDSDERERRLTESAAAGDVAPSIR
jgi:hypothetical protein